MSAIDDLGRIAERFAPQACRRLGTQALRRCLKINPGCVSDDLFEHLARAGDLSKLRLALALGPQRSPETLARALSVAHHFIPSSRRRRLVALALFAAAGPQRNEVAQRALAIQLRYRYPEGLGALFDGVDFSLPAPNGASWAWNLARFDPQGSPTLRRLVEQAFRKAWDAMPDKSIQAAGEHTPLAFLAAESGNVCALAAMEGWVDFDALHKGSSLLETALFSRREDAFEFLMPRSLPQADRFGRDAFGRGPKTRLHTPSASGQKLPPCSKSGPKPPTPP